MVAAEQEGERAARYRDAFAVTEFRALWLAQVLSVVGDQLARVAVTLLVYDRTRSALLAAVAFAASVIPIAIGGILLAGLADRFPRRRVMIVCDLARLALVLAMIIPRAPIAVLVGLLFVVTMLGPPFTSARMAIYSDVLTGDLYVLGNAVTLTTYQLALVVGFAAGGAVVAIAGIGPSLLADAATYAVSALITWLRVHARPAARPKRDAASGRGSTHAAAIWQGLRQAFGRPALRVPMLFGLLSAFYNVPEGVVAPLAHMVHGGSATVGILLAAGALGAAIGAVAFTRLVPPAARLRWMRPLAFCACATLMLFAFGPGPAAAVALLFVSGLFTCFQVAASAAFVRAAPGENRSQVFGIAQAEMSLGQGAAMMLAGVAAQSHAPTVVIAAGGLLGALVALLIPACPRGPVTGRRSWTRAPRVSER